MKIRQTSKLDRKLIGDGLEWIDLVLEEDEVGFTQHELVISRKDVVYELNSKLNHMYYSLHGNCKVTLSNGEEYNLDKDCMLAVPANISGRLVSLEDRTRMLITYAKPDQSCNNIQPSFRKLSEIMGSPRDVNWSRGQSRRFLVKDDGFGLSVHNTYGSPGNKSELHYKNNYESNYFVRGTIQYSWNDGKDAAKFSQEKVEDGDGIMYLLDKRDKHFLETFDNVAQCVCAFYPPLKGTEKHNFDQSGASCY